MSRPPRAAWCRSPSRHTAGRADQGTRRVCAREAESGRRRRCRARTRASTRPAIKLAALLPSGHRVKHCFVIGGKPVGAAWRYGRQIIGFVAPWETDAQDRAILSDFAACFDLDAGQLLEPVMLRWSERSFIPGADLGFRPGQITELAPGLNEPHLSVMFAGAERSGWPNSMEGAVQSGIRAAQRTQATLAADSLQRTEV